MAAPRGLHVVYFGTFHSPAGTCLCCIFLQLAHLTPANMPQCGVSQAVISRTDITIDELRHVPLDPILAGSTSANALISEMKTRLDGCTNQPNTLSFSTQRAAMMADVKGKPGLTK